MKRRLTPLRALEPMAHRPQDDPPSSQTLVIPMTVVASRPPLSAPSPSLPHPHPRRAARSAHTDDLVERLGACTDDDQRDILRADLISTNMPVARSIAAAYRNRGIPLEDLEQVAYLALTKAAHRFDASAGHAFLSFCVPTIRGEVRRYFRDHGWMVRPPRRIQELQQRIFRSQSELSFKLGRPPAAREIAEDLGEEIDHVLEAMDGQGAFTPASLDRLVGDGDVSLGDLIGSTQASVQSAEARVILAPAVRRLSDRDRRIIQMRFFDGLTQREIAEAIGVTQMQVSRLLARIFRDLRSQLGSLDDQHLGETA
jgi:RNA polymerase sigma-B factor